MAKDKREEFVVTDRRLFTSEGEIRPDVPKEEEPKAPPPEPPAAKPGPQPVESPKAHVESFDAGGEMPLPPTAEEQAQQKSAYDESTRRIDDQLRSRLEGRLPKDFEMTFERLIASLYMTALMQLGLVHEKGEQPRADVLGARQTIDTLAILQDKTKGNLTEAERNMLQQCLYELRMAWLELTNAIAQGPPPGAPGSPEKK